MARKKVEEGESPDLNPLLDHLISKNGLKNDAALARALQVAPPVISKYRHGRLPLGATMILFIHETFDIAVKEIRALLEAQPA